MIVGIGVDTVDVYRFNQWHTYSLKTLSRIFSSSEIEYCLHYNGSLQAQRFAVRFAAREAFFKALSTAYPNHRLSFLALCRYTTIEKHNNRPIFIFNWSCISDFCNNTVQPTIHVSLTHTQHNATAFVIIEHI